MISKNIKLEIDNLQRDIKENDFQKFQDYTYASRDMVETFVKLIEIAIDEINMKNDIAEPVPFSLNLNMSSNLWLPVSFTEIRKFYDYYRNFSTEFYKKIYVDNFRFNTNVQNTYEIIEWRHSWSIDNYTDKILCELIYNAYNYLSSKGIITNIISGYYKLAINRGKYDPQGKHYPVKNCFATFKWDKKGTAISYTNHTVDIDIIRKNIHLQGF